MNFIKSRSTLAWSLLLLLVSAVTGAWLLGYLMRNGPWAFNDSAVYVSTARSLARGAGFGHPGLDGQFLPLKWYPPFYSMLLAPFYWAGVDGFMGPVLLNILFFTGSLALLVIGPAALGAPLSWSLAGVILFMGARFILHSFTGVMSEAPYFFFSLLNIFLVASAWKRPASMKLALAAGVAAGLAGLTRIVGLANLGLAVVYLFLPTLPGVHRSRRVYLLLGYLAAGLFPALAWYLYGAFTGLGAAGRQIIVPENPFALVRTFWKATIELLVNWMPYAQALPTWQAKTLAFYGLLLVCVIAAAWVVLRKISARPPGAAWQTAVSADLFFFGVIGIYLVGLAGFMLLSTLVASVPPDIDDRTMSPLLFGLFWWMAGALALWGRSIRRPGVGWFIPVLFSVLAVLSWFPRTNLFITMMSSYGNGYYTDRWTESPTLRYLTEFPMDQVMVALDPGVILIHRGYQPFLLQGLDQTEPYGLGDTPDQIAMREKGAILVVFWKTLDNELVKRHGEAAGREKIRFLSELEAIREFDDGAIYRFP